MNGGPINRNWELGSLLENRWKCLNTAQIGGKYKVQEILVGNKTALFSICIFSLVGTVSGGSSYLDITTLFVYLFPHLEGIFTV